MMIGTGALKAAINLRLSGEREYYTRSKHRIKNIQNIKNERFACTKFYIFIYFFKTTPINTPLFTFFTFFTPKTHTLSLYIHF